ncbi:MAG: DNA methyltransferase, partial [Candidatus Poribacteria bacterium]
AFKIIDFVSQLEDELVKIWNKPKFVKNSNYVITLDRILSACHSYKGKNPNSLIERIMNHNAMQEQIKEWQELGIVGEDFKTDNVFETELDGKYLSKRYEHLPIDTKYFKDLELEILSLFDDLDRSLDGWLIKSENYQALNTILPKFKGKVQTIYIDPPFNTGEDFSYVDRFKDSSWLSLMNDRIAISKQFLSESGSIFVHLDHNAEHLGRILLDSIFKNGFVNNLAWSYRTGGASKKSSLPYKHDSILFFAKNIDEFSYKPVYERQYLEKSFIGSRKDEEGRYYTDTLLRDVIEGVIRDFSNNKVFNTRPVLNLSNEFYGFKTQKPEGLLYLLEYITFKSDNSLFMDYFAGSGTSLAVAHKLGRKWIGVEMGDYIDNFYIDEIELSNTERNKKNLYKKFAVLNCKEVGEKIIAVVKKVGILGRLKQVLYAKGRNEPCGISEDIKWQGGGFFKYYEFEQYEESLSNCKFGNGNSFVASDRNSYQGYIFLKDEKIQETLDVDYEKNSIKIDLSKLYLNIDIAETLSNLMGKWIKSISDEEIEFEDGTKISIKNFDYKLIKPLICW